MKIKAIIIDDEPDATEAIQIALIDYCPAVEILGISNQPEKGIELIRELKPNLVFLDIDMPRMNGFTLLSKIEDKQFDVIFITAYNYYAIEALRVNAVDYLLKPLDVKQLINAVEKAAFKIHEEQYLEAKFSKLIENINTQQRKIIKIPSSAGFELLCLDDIIRVEADGNYSRIYIKCGNSMLISKPLKFVVDLVANNSEFQLVHKSHLVNLLFVKKFSAYSGGELEMLDGSIVYTSRRKRKELIDYFNDL